MIIMKSNALALRNTKSIWLVGMILVALLPSALPAQERIPEPSELRRSDRVRTIAVTGNAEASAAPDQAVVRLGTTVQMSQANAAQAKVSETMQKALEGIEKIGVPRNSIRTANLTLTSVYSNEKLAGSSEAPRVVGFRANNTIEITLEDTKLVGKVIDAGIAAGANELQGVSFSLKDDLPQRIRTLTIASQEAKSKAQTIANALNLQLGSVIEVTEGGVHVVPFNEGFGGARMMAAAGAVRTPIEPGEVRVQANVTVRYEIGPSHP